MKDTQLLLIVDVREEDSVSGSQCTRGGGNSIRMAARVEQPAVEFDPRQHSAALQADAAAAQSARGSDGRPGSRHWASLHNSTTLNERVQRQNLIAIVM